MAVINFFTEEVRFQLKQKRLIRTWLQEVCQINNQTIDSLNYIYCSDKYLLEVNQTYLDHNYYTDIITFDNRDESDSPIVADLFISIDRVRENAKAEKTGFDKELHRVMVHGLLHLLGQNDKTTSQKEEMTKREEASLSLLQI